MSDTEKGAPGSIRGSAPATSGGQGGAGVPDLGRELRVRASSLVDKLDRATVMLHELAASLGPPHG